MLTIIAIHFLIVLVAVIIMAWRCTGSSNKQLVDNLFHSGIISKSRVVDAMVSTDRANFVRRSDISLAYQDSPQLIGYGATISAPHMHAMCLELLEDKLIPGNRVLDVGSGSGYLTASIARMIQPQGIVVGIDHIDELVEMSRENIKRDCKELMDLGIIKLVVGDGRDGYEEFAPYDAIHVGAASRGIPDKLIAQLKVGGKLVVPIELEMGAQALFMIEKTGDEPDDYKKEMITGVRYVPLTDRERQV
jgi:protein-L-isoaspartate(D-aspartate) O-methyltransferase